MRFVGDTAALDFKERKFNKMIWVKVIEAIILVIYVVINLVVAKKMSARNMYEDFIEGQCTVGMICANIFYAPAWILKGLKLVVVSTIK